MLFKLWKDKSLSVAYRWQLSSLMALLIQKLFFSENFQLVLSLARFLFGRADEEGVPVHERGVGTVWYLWLVPSSPSYFMVVWLYGSMSMQICGYLCVKLKLFLWWAVPIAVRILCLIILVKPSLFAFLGEQWKTIF